MSKRDPFPNRTFENDFTLGGFRPQRKATFSKPTHIAQTEEPWSRLYRAATCSSTQRNAAHSQNKVPKDSLDIHLSSIYNHHKNIFWVKNQVLYQRNTVCEDNTTADPNVGKVITLKSLCEEHIRVWVDPQRRSIYSQRW